MCMCLLLPLWIISTFVVGVINLSSICANGGNIKGYNILLGLYSFPVTIIVGTIYGIYFLFNYLFYKSKFKEFFQKTVYKL